MYSHTKERDVENLLEQYLSQNGYIFNVGDPNRNVYMQKAKTEEEVQKLQGLRPDYCIYLDKSSVSAEIIIETKKPGMKLQEALNQGIRYAQILHAKIVIIFDGLSLKSFYLPSLETLKIDGVEVQKILTPAEYKKFLALKTADIITQSEIEIKSKNDLISVFKFTNEKLRKAGIQKGIERFAEFSNILFLKLISEENDIIQQKIPEHINWNNYKNKKSQELLSYINEIVIPQLEKFYSIQNENTLFTQLLIQDSISLEQIIKKIDSLHLSSIETDIKGDAFEYFIQKYNSSNNDLGEYFTPRHIVNFLVSLAEPQYGEKIYDPFCGTGGMLISVYNYIYKNLKDHKVLTPAVLEDLRNNTLYGSEISSTARISKMNMILTGDGHTNVKQQDSLVNPVHKNYDVVISNIPFNLEVNPNDYYFTLGSSNGNTQCVEHILLSLNNKPQARAFVIVPEGFLNNDESYTTRSVLIKNKLLLGLISLPVGVFLPYADAKTTILVLQGFNGVPINKCFFYRVKNDGYTLTTRRRKIDGINDLDEFLHLFKHERDSLHYIQYADIQNEKNFSLLYFKYQYAVPKGYIKLKEVIRESKIKNAQGYPTATITKKEFYGVSRGEVYWGNNFFSVTSKSNEHYKVLHRNCFAYNPSRINIASIGINIQNASFAVSSAYTTFEVYNNEFLSEYVYLYLKSPEALEEIVTRCFGSARQTLRFEDLAEICIPRLPLSEQQKISSEAKKLYVEFTEVKDRLDTYRFPQY